MAGREAPWCVEVAYCFDRTTVTILRHTAVAGGRRGRVEGDVAPWPAPPVEWTDGRPVLRVHPSTEGHVTDGAVRLPIAVWLARFGPRLAPGATERLVPLGPSIRVEVARAGLRAHYRVTPVAARLPRPPLSSWRAAGWVAGVLAMTALIPAFLSIVPPVPGHTLWEQRAYTHCTFDFDRKAAKQEIPDWLLHGRPSTGPRRRKLGCRKNAPFAGPRAAAHGGRGGAPAVVE